MAEPIQNPGSEDKEILEGKMFAVIGYISILCVLTLILKKENKFALFHGKQGLVLFLGEIACWVVAIIPFLGWIISSLLTLVFILVSLYGILQALEGKYTKIPIVSDFADKIVL